MAIQVNNVDNDDNNKNNGDTTSVSDPERQSTATATDDDFRDEPKGDDPKRDEMDDAEFVSDDGEGNASVMKPRRPTRHHRARDSHFDLGDDNEEKEKDNEEKDKDDDDDDDDDEEDAVEQYRHSIYHIFSASVFVFSSLLYLGMACMVMDSYWHYKDVPMSVYHADDDATWWNYFVNCTDDNFLPENVTNADDDYTWYEWYNNSAFPVDDIVWLPRIANEDADGYEPYVSKYMILYFFAAFGFLITGVMEVILAHKYFWYRMLYYLMIIAAAFGMVSAVLTNKDPFWSNVTSAISVHIWALEAIIIVIQRFRGNSWEDNYDHDEYICGWSIKKWFFVADISFLIGTVGDCVTSYFYILQIDNYKLGISAIIFALGWLICAFVYLAVAIYDHQQYQKYFDIVLMNGGGGGGGGDNNNDRCMLGITAIKINNSDLDGDINNNNKNKKDGNYNGNGNNDSLNKKKKDSALNNLKRSAHTDAAPGSDLSFTVVSQSQHTTSSIDIDIDPHEEETEEEEKNSDDAVAVVVVSVIDTDTDTDTDITAAAAGPGPVVDNLNLNNNDDAHMDADGSFDRIEIVSSLFPMGHPSDPPAAGNANANGNVSVTTTTSDADDSAVPENIDIDIAISPTTFDLEDKGCCGMTSS